MGPLRIYTRTGDAGDTGLFGGGRVPKDHPRVEAYGAVDELNAALGVARAHDLPDDLDAVLLRVQQELFVLGSDLATPASGAARPDRVQRIPDAAAGALERDIDRCESELSPLTTFILPGGSSGGAALHFARTVCRRAERRVVGLLRAGESTPTPLVYLNRLSDLLFVMARLANARARRPETPWRPS